MRPANIIPLNPGCPQKKTIFYLLTIRHSQFNFVIALIMYLLISLGYHDLQMRNWVVILCKVIATTNFKSTTDNEYMKSQQAMFTHVPTWGSLLSLQLVHGNPHIHKNSMPDWFQFQYLPCVLPPACFFIFLAWSFQSSSILTSQHVRITNQVLYSIPVLLCQPNLSSKSCKFMDNHENHAYPIWFP